MLGALTPNQKRRGRMKLSSKRIVRFGRHALGIDPNRSRVSAQSVKRPALRSAIKG